MDILRKMFAKTNPVAKPTDEFRKPPWSDEVEADDELFGDRKFTAFQVFTNPLELQKHFDRQMNEIMKSLQEFEETDHIDKDFKEEFLKPGFESNIIEEFEKSTMDSDLDGEIYADQLHSLMQRLTPGQSLQLHDYSKPHIPHEAKKKLSDEEKVLGLIHGSISDDNDSNRNCYKRKKDMVIPKIPQHFGGVFEGTYQGPKMFGQSVMTQTLRKPDGTYETKRIIKDSEGNIKTTVTRTKEGKSETVTTYSNENDKTMNAPKVFIESNDDQALKSDGNIVVSKDGYALPKNLW